MKRIFAVLGVLLVSVLCSAAQISCPAGSNHCGQVSWTAPTSGGTPTGYNVYDSTTNGGCVTVTAATCTKVGTTTVPTTSFLIPSLAKLTTYYVVITAFNATGEGVPTVQVSGTTGDDTPGQPQTVVFQVK